MRNLINTLSLIFLSLGVMAQCSFTVELQDNWECNALTVQTSDSTYVITDSVDITVVDGNPIIFSTNSCSETSSFTIDYGTIDTITVEGESLSWSWAVNCGALPVELVSFTGRITNKMVKLDWILASQINLKEIILFRNNKVLWTFTNRDEAQMYWQYYDEDPEPGINYYELMFVDHDGSYEYSPLVAVKYDENAIIHLQQDANTHVFRKKEISNAEYKATIYKTDGSLIANSVWLPHNDLIVRLNDPGFYFITLYNDAEQHHYKVFVK